MRIASWNVNSLNVRQERLRAWLERHEPDILCLQELKLTEDKFPKKELEALGYQAVSFGQKTYNGVAILAREPIEVVRKGFDDGVDDPQARFISALVQGVRVLCAYVPNGSRVGSEKYAYKLAWYKRLHEYLKREHRPEESLVLCGDFNVAPSDLDVARLDEWRDSVLCHADARTALRKICSWGLADTFRRCNPETVAYSWWDYRMLGFPKGNGLRIDFVLATEFLLGRCSKAWIDREERKGKKPSDHAPVVADFDMS